MTVTSNLQQKDEWEIVSLIFQHAVPSQRETTIAGSFDRFFNNLVRDVFPFKI